MNKLILFGFWLLFLVTTVWSGSSDFDVLDFGAIADGKTDNTKAFQAVLDKAAEKGGTVHVPSGQFRIAGTLNLPPAVALVGIAEGPNIATMDKGTMLLAYAGRDAENSAPFITMQSSSTIKGLTIFYPELKADDIHPYPWTLQIKGLRCNVIDITLVNSYNGIDCGTFYQGEHYLRNIYMTALKCGVYIDRTTDIGRIENVHIHPVVWADLGASYQAIHDYIIQNLEGFIIGRCDWEYMTNCFVIWAKVGFRFIETQGDPVGNDPQANILITQSGSDVGPLSVIVEKVQDHAGIAFENCQFMDGFLIEKTNLGPVKLTNCGFWGWAEAIRGSHIVNKGEGAVMLTSCHFNAMNWQECRWKPEIPFIEMQNGTLQMIGCRFQDNANVPDAHVYLGEKVKAAVLMGNSVRVGKLKVVNKSKGDVQIIGNVRY